MYCIRPAVNYLSVTDCATDFTCGFFFLVMWYYDPEANACAQFWYGGCQGNSNRFEMEDLCQNTCHMPSFSRFLSSCVDFAERCCGRGKQCWD
uniref:BPTI/Kunitz inhibitor domain-containing protein n=1 Tax=Sinocyclocheilus grahami TaxID=75366 RepID=A0A672R801_SINGR